MTASANPVQSSTCGLEPQVPGTTGVFRQGGDRRAVVQPYGNWHTFAPGAHFVGGDKEFNVTNHPAEATVVMVRPTGSIIDDFGEDAAQDGIEYQFKSFGDGTAALSPSVSCAGSVLFFPAHQYGEEGPWSFENAGFWRVERVSRDGKAFLRREGSGGPGSSQVIKATNKSDIQAVAGLDCGTAFVSGPFPGLWPVACATGRWVGLRIPSDVPEMQGVIFDHLLISQSYIGYLYLEVDRPAIVKVNEAKEGVILLPVQAGVENQMAQFEMTGFVTSIDVVNLSCEPMKLRMIDVIGK